MHYDELPESEWGTYCKWDDDRPWHVALPPRQPHYLSHVEKARGKETVLKFNITELAGLS